MASRRVRGRCLWQPRQHRCLWEAELTDAAAKEVSARRLDSVNAVAHVDDVEVELEDLLLGERVLDETRQSELGELLPQRARWIFANGERVARHLHRDGAESFARAPGANVGHDRAEEPAPVETAVLVESSVFGGDERLLDELGDGAERNIYA